MKTNKVKPGYLVTEETRDMIEEHAGYLTEKYGFRVSHNKALEVLVKAAFDHERNEPCKG